MTTKKSSGHAAVLPVSRKFYLGLMSRVNEILTAIFPDTASDYLRPAKRMIDNYLSDNLHSIPEQEIIPEVRIIFLTLKAEIDRARERSLRARRAARLRKISPSKTHRAAASVQTNNTDATAAQYQTEKIELSPASTLRPLAQRRRRTGLRWKPALTATGPRHRY